MKVSIKEISRITGYSPATVSNALNRKKGVNIETSTKIFRVAKELGYISESSITKIKLIVYKKNGMIIEDTPFFSIMLDGFEQECRAKGYEMTMSYVDRRQENYLAELNSMIHENSTAIVVLGTELNSEEFEIFRSARGPVLTLDYWNTDMSCNGVAINNADSAITSVNYLINKGHTEIGYLRGKFRINAFKERSAGYRVAMNRSELTINKDYIVTLSTTMEGAYRDMATYLKAKPILPTAYFADNDIIALGAMRALQEAGYRIPEDVSIIGFDDLPYCEISFPRLTSIRVSKKEMGQTAMRRLAQIIQGEDSQKLKILMGTELIERESVKDMNKKDKESGYEKS